MRRRTRVWMACLLAVCLDMALVAGEMASGDSRLTVRVMGLRSTEGRVAIALFDSAGSFDARTDPVRSAFLPIEGTGCNWIVEGLPGGAYAVMLYHDRNDNGELDKRRPLGIPKEPYGFSNDARAPFGPPSFEAARFELHGDLTIVIEAR